MEEGFDRVVVLYEGCLHLDQQVCLSFEVWLLDIYGGFVQSCLILQSLWRYHGCRPYDFLHWCWLLLPDQTTQYLSFDELPFLIHFPILFSRYKPTLSLFILLDKSEQLLTGWPKRIFDIAHIASILLFYRIFADMCPHIFVDLFSCDLDLL